MFTKITENITSKIGGAIAIWVLSFAMIALTVTFALGKAAIEDNSKQMAGYSAAITNFSKDIERVIADVKTVTSLVNEQREASFNTELRNLTKQIYKIQSDPDDIKEVDVAAAADFCDSTLFDDHILELSGSERVVVLSSCQQANVWVKENTT